MDRRIWLVFAITVLFCIGMTVYYQIAKRNFDNSLPQVPTAVAPQGDEAPPGDTSHPHEETRQEASATKRVLDDDDWRTDEGHARSHTDTHGDPWTQLSSPEDDMLAEESEEPYPPLNWPDTLDPALYAEYYRAQIMKQFSDVPAIDRLADTLAAGKLKLRAQIPMTLDEALAYNEALNALWPDTDTQRSIAAIKERIATGRSYQDEPIKIGGDRLQHLEPLVVPLIEQHGEKEGLRLFKTLDPRGAMALKRAMIREAAIIGETTPGYYESRMQVIEQLFGDSDL